MIRRILAVIAGFVVASLVMMAMETMNGKVFHPELGALAAAKDAEAVREMEAKAPPGTVADPREVAMHRREVMRDLMKEAPTGALLVVALGWILGSVAGGFTATKIGRMAATTTTFALGGLLLLAGVANNLMLPPPTWFWIVTMILFLPATYLGAWLAVKMRTSSG